jgi:hypothetical protein
MNISLDFDWITLYLLRQNIKEEEDIWGKCYRLTEECTKGRQGKNYSTEGIDHATERKSDFRNQKTEKGINARKWNVD